LLVAWFPFVTPGLPYFGSILCTLRFCTRYGYFFCGLGYIPVHTLLYWLFAIWITTPRLPHGCHAGFILRCLGWVRFGPHLRTCSWTTCSWLVHRFWIKFTHAVAAPLRRIGLRCIWFVGHRCAHVCVTHILCSTTRFFIAFYYQAATRYFRPYRFTTLHFAGYSGSLDFDGLRSKPPRLPHICVPHLYQPRWLRVRHALTHCHTWITHATGLPAYGLPFTAFHFVYRPVCLHSHVHPVHVPTVPWTHARYVLPSTGTSTYLRTTVRSHPGIIYYGCTFGAPSLPFWWTFRPVFCIFPFVDRTRRYFHFTVYVHAAPPLQVAPFTTLHTFWTPLPRPYTGYLITQFIKTTTLDRLDAFTTGHTLPRYPVLAFLPAGYLPARADWTWLPARGCHAILLLHGSGPGFLFFSVTFLPTTHTRFIHDAAFALLITGLWLFLRCWFWLDYTHTFFTVRRCIQVPTDWFYGLPTRIPVTRPHLPVYFCGPFAFDTLRFVHLPQLPRTFTVAVATFHLPHFPTHARRTFTVLLRFSPVCAYQLPHAVPGPSTWDHTHAHLVTHIARAAAALWLYR